MKTDVDKTENKLDSQELQTPGETVTGKVPILPVRDMVAFPQTHVPFMIATRSAPMIDEALKGDRIIGLLTVKDTDVEDPVPGQLYEIGTIAKIRHVKKNEDGMMVVLMNNMHRFKVETWHTEGPHLAASVTYAPETVETDVETTALQRQLTETIKAVLEMKNVAVKPAIDAIDDIESPLQLAYVTAMNVELPTEKRQAILETDSVSEKMQTLLLHLTSEKEVLEIGRRIQSEIREKMDKSQRELRFAQADGRHQKRAWRKRGSTKL